MYQPPQLASEVIAFAQEHEKTIKHCDQLQQLLGKMNTALSPTEQAKVVMDLHNLEVEFMKELEPHYYNEEEALFPVLSQHMEFNTGIIPDILNEHEKLRALFQELQFGIHELHNAWTPEHINLVNQGATTFISFMTGHIEKEDQELYPKVEAILSIEEKKQVYFKLYGNV